MNDSKSLFLLAIIPSIISGSTLIWRQGLSVANLFVILVMISISLVCMFYLRNKQANQSEEKNQPLQKQILEPLQNLMAYTEEIEKLFLMVSPKLFEQILTARELTEQEIADLVGKFSVIFNELQKIIDFADDMDDATKPNDAEGLKNNAQNLSIVIDGVLQSLQFQDRVSQILTQVEDNLTNLTSTVKQIQLQGNDRHRDMVKVEEILNHMQKKYDTVNQLSTRAHGNAELDELTFF